MFNEQHIITIETSGPLELVYEREVEALEMIQTLYSHATESGYNRDFSIKISRVKEGK